jgi:type IX secretion system PorP/SprF family membrane protein
MKKIILSILTIVSCTFLAKAQDEAIFSHYIVNPMLINPAFAGNNDNTEIFGHYRSQWTGFPGAPKTYMLTASLPVNEKVGVGGLLLTEKFGVTNRLRGQLNYAYRYTSKRYKWGMGFSTEFHRYRLDQNAIDPNNPLYETGDQMVTERMKGLTFFDATFGAFTEIDNKYIFSLAFPNLIRVGVGQPVGTTTKQPKSFFRQVILMAGYRMAVKDVKLEPSLQIHKLYQSPFEVDLNVKAGLYDEKLVAALTIRPGRSGQVGILAGTKQDNFAVYYSYNSSLSDFKTYQRNAHEVSLAIILNKNQNKIERGGRRYRN